MYFLTMLVLLNMQPTTENGLEYATFLPEHDAVINDTEYKAGEFIEFERHEGTIEESTTTPKLPSTSFYLVVKV